MESNNRNNNNSREEPFTDEKTHLQAEREQEGKKVGHRLTSKNLSLFSFPLLASKLLFLLLFLFGFFSFFCARSSV